MAEGLHQNNSNTSGPPGLRDVQTESYCSWVKSLFSKQKPWETTRNQRVENVRRNLSPREPHVPYTQLPFLTPIGFGFTPTSSHNMKTLTSCRSYNLDLPKSVFCIKRWVSPWFFTYAICLHWCHRQPDWGPIEAVTSPVTAPSQPEPEMRLGERALMLSVLWAVHPPDSVNF